MTIVWWVLSALAMLLAGWGMTSSRRVLYPERHIVEPPFPLRHSTCHTVAAEDGTSFNAWALEATAPRARLLICHGYYADRFQVAALADRLRDHGNEVVLCELRGHGARRGPCTLGLREAQDAEVVLRWAEQREGGPGRLPIGLLGFSMGAAVVCRVALHDAGVGAVVVDSIYERLFPVLCQGLWQRYHVPAVPLGWITWWSVQVALGHRLDTLDPLVLAPRLHQPLLAIQGGADQRITSSQGMEFYRRWAGPKERWFEPSVGHVGMFKAFPQAYGERVARFFQEALRSKIS